MRVVSNTSPISNLAIIGRLHLLKGRYGRLFVPPAVAPMIGAAAPVSSVCRLPSDF
jgi:predicted nucleic acid-binding protein